VLSIPLDPNNHILDGSYAFDATRSYSTSSSIHLVQHGGSYQVSISVYNLGATEALVYIDLVLWFINAARARKAVTVRHEYNLTIDGRRPGRPPPMITTPLKDIPSLPNYELTHIYAVAYDPMFDRPDAEANALLVGNIPDFGSNPARLSRHVGCLNVYFAQNGYGLDLRWARRDEGFPAVNPFIHNRSLAPVDFAVLNLSGAHSRTALWNEHLRLEVVHDLRYAAQIKSFGEASGEMACDLVLISQHPDCDPTCSPSDPTKTVGQIIGWIHDGVFIEGSHEGTGNIIDIKDLPINLPWRAGQATVTIRLLLR
jgi:hypothetical protein